MIKDLLKEEETKMKKAIESLKHDFQAIRTGRASPALVEQLPVEAYETTSPLIQLATISAPDARLLTIRPFDASVMPNIEKAILKSGLGLTPSNDGKLIRLPIPQLTEERRRELVKRVHKRVEEAHIAIRNIRHHALDDLKEWEKEKLISEDDLFRGRDQLQELTDRFIVVADEAGALKEKEVMDI
ncbi:MAG: ribosome recycling factor [Chloroflexi bacterium]|nr:ribosome recycling factor [Chloroflexota bacterium]